MAPVGSLRPQQGGPGSQALRQPARARRQDGAADGARCLHPRQEGVSIWVVPSSAIVASDPGEKSSYFDPMEDKVYRHPTFYDLPRRWTTCEDRTMTASIQPGARADVHYLLRLGDACLVLSHRLSEWCGHSPILEEDLALTNTALDLLGQARALLTRAGQLNEQPLDEDQLAFLREERHYLNPVLMELPRGDFAFTQARKPGRGLLAAAAVDASAALVGCRGRRHRGQGGQGSPLPPAARGRMGRAPGRRQRGVHPPHAGRADAAVALRERALRRRRRGHRRRHQRPGTDLGLAQARMGCGDGRGAGRGAIGASEGHAACLCRPPRASTASTWATCWRPCNRCSAPIRAACESSTRIGPAAGDGASDLGCGRLSAAWEVLSQVPDPEVPAVSLVELGIVRDLTETAEGVEVVLTPTYSGCPATEAIEQNVREALARFGTVTITMRRAPAWTTDWITDEGREKLRRYGIAPPAHLGETGAHTSSIRIVRRHAGAAIACRAVAARTPSSFPPSARRPARRSTAAWPAANLSITSSRSERSRQIPPTTTSHAMSLHFHPLRVSAKHQDTDDAVVLLLRRARGAARHLPLHAGAIPDPARRRRRPGPAPLLLHLRRHRRWRVARGVRKVDGGAFSNWVHGSLKTGDEIQVFPPQAASTCRWIGDGAALRRHRRGLGHHAHPVHHEDGAGARARQPLHADLRQPPPRLDHVQGRTRGPEEPLHDAVDAASRVLARACGFAADGGSAGPREAGRLPGWSGAGGDDRSGLCLRPLRDERTGRGRAAGSRRARGAHPHRALRHARDADRPPGAARGACRRCRGRQGGGHPRRRVARDRVPQERSQLLDAAARAGMDVPFSCKSGVCSTCRCKLIEGEVRMDKNFALEKHEVAAGFILSCQAHA
ncbi:phenylacetic acid catabolic protein [Ditylenchus destructor]|nr:phenylacetic acid catabolic protein [Ditylenchus destructor]